MDCERRVGLRIRIAMLFVGVISVTCSPTSAPPPPPPKTTCIRVPAAYPTIQAGIDAAVDGDTILIAYGTYRGAGNTNLDPLGKAIIITGAGDPDSTIIDCGLEGEERTNGFFIRRGEGNETAIERLTITGAGAPSGAWGSAVRCRHASPRIMYCVIRGNEGCVVYLRYSSAYLFGCRIDQNVSRGQDPAIYCLESAPKLQACEIVSNLIWQKPAVLCEKGCIELDGCVLEHNVNARGDGGAIGLERSTAWVHGTTIARNVCGVGSGGAVALNNGSSLNLYRSTMAENMAGYSGGAVMAYGFDIVAIRVSIIWGNCAPEYSAIEAAPASTVEIAASAIDTSRVGGGGQFVYEGQIVTADPMFCHAAGCGSAVESNYNLQPESPCAGEPRMGSLWVGCEEAVRWPPDREGSGGR